MVVASQSQFDERNPRYYIYSCCHVRTGVMVISIIEILFWALAVISVVVTPDHDNFTMSYFKMKWLVPVRAIITVVCAVLAIVGIRSIVPAFLISRIVIQVINIFLDVFLYMVCLMLATNMYPAIIIIIIVFGSCLVFEVWLMGVFERGYKYLKLKKEFLGNNQNSFVVESVPMSGYNPTVYAGDQHASWHLNYAQFGYQKAP